MTEQKNKNNWAIKLWPRFVDNIRMTERKKRQKRKKKPGLYDPVKLNTLQVS